MRESAAEAPPMKARQSMNPVFISGGIVSRPEPDMKWIVPAGKAFANASIVRKCANPPTVGIFSMTIFPIKRAGTVVF